MKCLGCQARLPEDAAFCGRRGSTLRAEQGCVRRGRANLSDMRFCLGCGSPLGQPA